MPPPKERWVRWSRWYAVIAAIGLLAGAIWGISARPPTHTESKVPVPGPTTTHEVQVPLLPDARPPGEREPGFLLKPQPTKTVTLSPKEKQRSESGPDGRKEVMPSDGGSTTGGSLDGGAGAEQSVAPSSEA